MDVAIKMTYPITPGTTNIPWEAILTIVLFMIVHLVGTVWWMSKINTTVDLKFDAISRSVDRMIDVLGKAWNKEDALREIGKVEAIAQAAHDRIDVITSNGRS